MSRPGPRRRAPVDAASLMEDLETIKRGAMADSAWAPAIRAVELQGRHIGLWRNDAPPQSSLADLINEAAANGDGDREQSG